MARVHEFEEGFYIKEDYKGYYIAFKYAGRNLRTDEQVWPLLGLTLRKYRKLLRSFGPIKINEGGECIIEDMMQAYKTVRFLRDNHNDSAKILFRMLY